MHYIIALTLGLLSEWPSDLNRKKGFVGELANMLGARFTVNKSLLWKLFYILCALCLIIRILKMI